MAVKPALRNWLMQRLSAVFLAFYSVLMPVYIWHAAPADVLDWQHLFAPWAMRLSTLFLVLILTVHAWLGMNNILLDYIQSPRLRRPLQAMVTLWLLTCVVAMAGILWGDL